MTPSCRRRYRNLVLLAFLSWGAFEALPVAAASATFADPAGVCAGSSPCFLTLQEAVDHAGPAPATIQVFPGVYAESVDLAAMGSAIGQGPGDLTIQGVDAGGAPAVGLAQIDPGASGGPGTGRGLSAFDPINANLPMSLELNGLEATSPDSEGFFVLVSGDLSVSDLGADGCGLSGMILAADGAVTARNLEAVLNTENGIFIGAGEMLDVEALVAERNDEGIVLFAPSGLLASDLKATANGLGIGVGLCNGAELELLQASSNTGQGVFVEQPAPGGTLPCGGPSLGAASLDELAALVAGILPASSPKELEAWKDRSRRPSGASGASGAPGAKATGGMLPIQLRNSQAVNNGKEGIVVFTDGPAIVTDTIAQGNGFIGMGLGSTTAEVSSSAFEQNSGGALILAQDVTMTSCQATDNLGGGGGGGLPGEGYGFVVGAETAVLTGLNGSRNLEAGLAVALLPSGSATFEVNGGTFEDNRAGIETGPHDSLLSLVIQDAFVRGNQEVGVLLPYVARATLLDSQSQDNAVGLRASPTQSLRVMRSSFTGNQVGAGVDFAPGAAGVIYCSNFTTSSSGVGLELLSDSALDASANFWGSPLGPMHPGNPGGAGEQVLDSVNGAFGTVGFTPFLGAPATADDCPAEVAVQAVPTSPTALVFLGLLLATSALACLRGFPQDRFKSRSLSRRES